MKVRPVRAVLFHADTHTHKHNEANRYFSQFCEPAWKGACQVADITHLENRNLIKQEDEIF